MGSSRTRPKMVVFCVDGGLATVVRRYRLFDLSTQFPQHLTNPAMTLRTIYPSSTAPAHASFLTGAYPERHGIVGNCFWSGEPVADVRRRAPDPLATFHPYERSTLTAPSLLDWFAERGAAMAAVHFPQTFSRGLPGAQLPALYCLYAPARRVSVPLAPCDGGELAGRCALSYFGDQVQLSVARPATADGHPSLLLNTPGEHTVRLRLGAPARAEASVPAGRLSFAVTLERLDRERAELAVGTCVLTLLFGGLAPSALASLPGPSSLNVEYTANPDHAFSEAPRADWVGQAALRVRDQYHPDVFFVRFNQADHAQEFLYWHAARGEDGDAAAARDQIVGTYRTIDANIRAIAEAVGPDASYVLFSDHGIDWVETHIRPNLVLNELGWADRMIFQGDSNCAYLYCDEPLADAEKARVAHAVTALHPAVRVLGTADLRALRLPATHARVGRMAIASGAHTEFQYHGDRAVEAVRSASHGYLPSDSAMSGFFQMSGPGTAQIAWPRELVDVAGVVRAVWLRRCEEER